MQCLARAFSPTIFRYVTSALFCNILLTRRTSSIYALSQEYNILNGFGWVPAMVFLSLLGVYQSTSVLRATR